MIMDLFLFNGLFFCISLKMNEKKYGSSKICRIYYIAYLFILLKFFSNMFFLL